MNFCITGLTRAGTGKTYASAFAMREESQKKVLFLVHREQITKQAMASYRRVFGNTRTFGLLSGNSKNYDADYLFATMQMMSKDETLAHFKSDAFQTIIIDETHRIGSPSYQKILKYFHPRFWLGMSATPERSDGYDVYALFGHNIAYEIRLQQAMEEAKAAVKIRSIGVSNMSVKIWNSSSPDIMSRRKRWVRHGMPERL